VRGVNNIRQNEICTAEPRSFEVETGIEKLKTCKSSCIDEIPSGLIRAVFNTLCYEVHKPNIYIWNKEELLSSERNLLFYIFIRSVIKLTVVIIKEHHYYQLHTKFYPKFFCQG
jgi:hypothetical protein